MKILELGSLYGCPENAARLTVSLPQVGAVWGPADSTDTSVHIFLQGGDRVRIQTFSTPEDAARFYQELCGKWKVA